LDYNESSYDAAAQSSQGWNRDLCHYRGAAKERALSTQRERRRLLRIFFRVSAALSRRTESRESRSVAGERIADRVARVYRLSLLTFPHRLFVDLEVRVYAAISVHPIILRDIRALLFPPGALFANETFQNARVRSVELSRNAIRVYNSAIPPVLLFISAVRVALFGGMNRERAAYLSDEICNECCRSCTRARSTCKCASLLYRDAATTSNRRSCTREILPTRIRRECAERTRKETREIKRKRKGNGERKRRIPPRRNGEWIIFRVVIALTHPRMFARRGGIGKLGARARSVFPPPLPP